MGNLASNPDAFGLPDSQGVAAVSAPASTPPTPANADTYVGPPDGMEPYTEWPIRDGKPVDAGTTASGMKLSTHVHKGRLLAIWEDIIADERTAGVYSGTHVIVYRADHDGNVYAWECPYTSDVLLIAAKLLTLLQDLLPLNEDAQITGDNVREMLGNATVRAFGLLLVALPRAPVAYDGPVYARARIAIRQLDPGDYWAFGNKCMFVIPQTYAVTSKQDATVLPNELTATTLLTIRGMFYRASRGESPECVAHTRVCLHCGAALTAAVTTCANCPAEYCSPKCLHADPAHVCESAPSGEFASNTSIPAALCRDIRATIAASLRALGWHEDTATNVLARTALMRMRDRATTWPYARTVTDADDVGIAWESHIITLRIRNSLVYMRCLPAGAPVPDDTYERVYTLVRMLESACYHALIKQKMVTRMA